MTSKKKKFDLADESNNGIRLPLDLLLVHDVEDLEEALRSKWAVESDGEIIFLLNKKDLEEYVLDLDEYKYYSIDEIEHDRIRAVMDLLNKAEDDNILDHIINRLVR
jgi:PHD/YefM family antitoxin component YafN of YafNO toxin-antitoxin module